MTYDFSTLSPADFEELSRDLLQAALKVRFESFAAGRDDGIDLRYSKSSRRSWIVQCKHYIKSGWSALFSNLKHEIPKVKKLKPNRYILTTSVNLTPRNKRDIVSLFGGSSMSTSDILGGDDLRNLLRLHPKVERAHFKLWLASSTVLEKVINAGTFVRTDALVDELGLQVRLYVSNESFSRSLDILDKNHVCIIAGAPGIGKTFLARMLMLHHLQQEYEAYVISSDIDEADRLYNPVSHQFFYYDDFLGTAFDESLGKNEDARLSDFLQRVARTPNKRIVLTTREYILNRATTRYERLHSAIEESLKCIVRLEDYTRLIRGRILYNHLFFSKVSLRAVQEFCSTRSYMEVIDHSNFSPRLIEFAVRHAESSAAVVDLGSFVTGVLADPSKLWDHAFKSQLSSNAQAILLAMLFLPSVTPLDDLASAASALAEVRGEKLSGLEFKLQLKQLEGTFISIDNLFGRMQRADYFSPAIADYLLGILEDTGAEVKSLVMGSLFSEQILGFLSAAQSRNVDAASNLRFPNLHQWVGNNSDYLLQAIGRTWRSSCTWRWRHSPGKVEFVRDAANLEANLLKVVEAGKAFDLPLFVRWAESRLVDLAANWLQSEGDRASAAALISLVEVAPEMRSVVRDWSLKELAKAEDFEAALQLYEAESDLADEVFQTRLWDSFNLFVQSREQYILEDASDPSDAEVAIYEVESIAGRLGLDPGWDEGALRERIDRLESWRDDFDADSARDAHADDALARSERMEIRRLDSLFDSLARASTSS